MSCHRGDIRSMGEFGYAVTEHDERMGLGPVRCAWTSAGGVGRFRYSQETCRASAVARSELSSAAGISQSGKSAPTMTAANVS
jgi:hypothetical protein